MQAAADRPEDAKETQDPGLAHSATSRNKAQRSKPQKNNFFSPPSGPAQRLLQGPPSKSKFLAAAKISWQGGPESYVRDQ